MAVYDACVLYPAPLRDLLIRLAQTGIVQAHWSTAILDECFRSILKQNPDLKPAALQRTRELMTRAVRDCMVEGHEPLIERLQLPDPDDRHVLAAAIRIGAHSIVTFNLRDFPSAQLAQHGVEARHPDDFVLEAIDRAPSAVVEAVNAQAAALKNPKQTVHELLGTMQAQRLVRSAAKLREIMGA